jgi:hypothetical protein
MMEKTGKTLKKNLVELSELTVGSDFHWGLSVHLDGAVGIFTSVNPWDLGTCLGPLMCHSLENKYQLVWYEK